MMAKAFSSSALLAALVSSGSFGVASASGPACPLSEAEMQEFVDEMPKRGDEFMQQYAQEWKTSKTSAVAYRLAKLGVDAKSTVNLLGKVVGEFPYCVDAAMHLGNAFLASRPAQAAEEHFDKIYQLWTEEVQFPMDFWKDYASATEKAGRALTGGPGKVSAERWQRIIEAAELTDEDRCRFMFRAGSAYDAFMDFLSEPLRPMLASACGDLPGCAESYDYADHFYRSGLKLEVCDVCARNLGTVQLRAGRVAEAMELFQSHIDSMRAPGADGASSMSRAIDRSLQRTSRARLKHDADQLEFLVEEGRIAEQTYSPWIKKFRSMAQQLPEEGSGQLPEAAYDQIKAMYGRLNYVTGGGRLPNAILTPRDDWESLTASFHEGKVVVIDNFLSEEALKSIREWTTYSTIYFDAKGRGYVGSYSEDGFSAPIVAQLAEELAAALPAVTQGSNLTQAWAYKFDNEKNAGIKMHADDALVNCNFWTTPDSANLDPARGGLEVWLKKVPVEWDFSQFNTDAGYSTMLEMIEGAEMVRVPYRENRMVLFNSQYLHRTDDINFKPGYANRRINLTFLFGDKMLPAATHEVVRAKLASKGLLGSDRNEL